MSNEDDDDDEALLARLESELPDEDDDYLLSCDLCMSAQELIAKASAGETSLGLIATSSLSDAECSKLVQSLVKLGGKVEVLSLEAVELSPAALGKLLETVADKLLGLKALNLGGVALPEQVYARLAQYVEANRTLRQLHLSQCNLTPVLASRLVQALERNPVLVDFQIDFDDMPGELQAKIDKLVGRNRAGGGVVAASMSTSSNTATPTMGVWVKGPVHFGMQPPDQSGAWTRLTFDAQFVAANSSSLSSTAATTTTAPTTAKAPEATTTVKRAFPAPPAAAAAAAPAPAAKPPASSYLFRVKALYPYDADDADEVSFAQGDFIQITKEVDEDWYVGRVESSGQRGQVPSNYVQRV